MPYPARPGASPWPDPGACSLPTGILGAAFDPIHYAHVAMAVAAQKRAGLNDVWLVPSPSRWDKTPWLPGPLRCSLIEIMLGECKAPRLYLNTDEVNSAEPHRGSYLFLQSLRKAHPNRTFYFILGADAYAGIPQWRDNVTGERNGEQLLRDVPLIVIPRKGHPVQPLTNHATVGNTPPFIEPFIMPSLFEIAHKSPEIFSNLPQHMAWLSASSTRIREQLRRLSCIETHGGQMQEILKDIPQKVYDGLHEYLLKSGDVSC